MKKLGHVNPISAPGMIMVMYYDEREEQNRYRIYHEWWSASGASGPTHHRKLICKADSSGSCIDAMNRYIQQHDEESR